MKVNANSAPVTSFLVERHPQDAEKAIVTMYADVGEPDTDGAYLFDAYRVVVRWSDDLAMRVAANASAWLDAAKSMDTVALVQEAADVAIAENEAAIDELLLLIGGDA